MRVQRLYVKTIIALATLTSFTAGCSSTGVSVPVAPLASIQSAAAACAATSTITPRPTSLAMSLSTSASFLRSAHVPGSSGTTKFRLALRK